MDAPRLVERIETAAQWGELDDAAEDALVWPRRSLSSYRWGGQAE